MRIASLVFKRMRKGYKALASKGLPFPSIELGGITGGLTTKELASAIGIARQVEAQIAGQRKAIGVSAEEALPMKPQGPMEVTGELALRHPEIKSEIAGIEIPIIPYGAKFGRLDIKEETPVTTRIYPLIPSKPKKGEPVLAYAKIFWDAKLGRYIYQVVEPQLTPKLKELLNKIKELLEQKLDVDFSKLKMIEVSEYLRKQLEELINYFKFKITPVERQILRYYIERDFMGLGKMEPFMRDKNIEDISCDGVDIPIFIYHRDPNLGSVVTNVAFNDSDELDSFITRLVQLSGKSISVAQPLVDGSLPDGSRLQATLATDIARRGSNFTIRKFSDEPLTPIHLMNYKTADAKMLAYLWLAVEFGRSILIAGGTASGKTSMLNVISLFIRPDKKIISIEDTAELRLPHPHWIPTVARTPVSTDVERIGDVDMFDLLRESLRQRPDYIVVGEVRGKEAYILFQQMATGHPSLATIHAENISKLLDRLTTQPISLPKSLIGSLDLILFLLRVRHKNKFVRRVNDVSEIIKFDSAADQPVVNQVFQWDPVNDTYEVIGKSAVLEKISQATGIKPQDLIDELQRRSLVLTWMQQHNITDYLSVHKVIDMYYTSPKRLLAFIMGER